MDEREQIEIKKFEKTLKKEREKMEDIAQGSNSKVVFDHILRTLVNMRKLTKEKNRIQNDRDKESDLMAEQRALIVKHVKKKDVLAMMSTQLL